MSKNCEHKWEKVERSPEDMGISYYYLQCTDPKCSKVIYPMDQLQKLMDHSEEHQFMFLEDWILTLFHALPESDIVGWTSLQKQVFLVMVEFAQEERIPTENIGFYAYDYGPYDDRITDATDVMVEGGIIEKQGRYSPKNVRFRLTPAGTERAAESFDKLTEDQKKKLIELRKEYQMWGPDGLLKYVYTKYDQYTRSSKIRRSVLDPKKK
ncbi:MAG: hypothetical protein FWD92_03170 [Methanomassiliicoccaceae archaeon]|nr:hypothetical protein [Methanomassiliicoccaceae archaeon]